MALTLTVANSCQILSIVAESYTGASTANITVTHVGTTTSYSQVLNYSGTPLKGSVNIPVSSLSNSHGVYKVCLSENAREQICLPVLIHCDIDCCLAKLTNELLDCACDCPKCASSLAVAQKVFLLLQAANSSATLASATYGSTNPGYYEDISNKYAKALELCDNSCGCDC